MTKGDAAVCRRVGNTWVGTPALVPIRLAVDAHVADSQLTLAHLDLVRAPARTGVVEADAIGEMLRRARAVRERAVERFNTASRVPMNPRLEGPVVHAAKRQYRTRCTSARQAARHLVLIPHMPSATNVLKVAASRADRTHGLNQLLRQVVCCPVLQPLPGLLRQS